MVNPTLKETSCKFIVSQLASSLLTTTGNLTSSLGNTLGNTLGVLNLGGKKNTPAAAPPKSGVQTSHKQTAPNNRGILGIL